MIMVILCDAHVPVREYVTLSEETVCTIEITSFELWRLSSYHTECCIRSLLEYRAGS